MNKQPVTLEEAARFGRLFLCRSTGPLSTGTNVKLVSRDGDEITVSKTIIPRQLHKQPYDIVVTCTTDDVVIRRARIRH